MRVTHVITGLSQGGAQEMLLKLLHRIDPADAVQSVISLRQGGPYRERIERTGVAISAIGMQPRGRAFGGLRRLAEAIAEARPHVIQTWMYHADLLGGLAACWSCRRVPVLWNIRHSNLERGVDRWSTRVIARACAWTSRRLPARILVNSETGRRFHVGLGYAAERMCVVPNGFDTGKFRPAPEAGARIRERCGIPLEAPVVGQIARYHPQKDYPTLIAAADRILAEQPDVHFLFCGTNVSPANAELTGAIGRTRRPERFHLLGERRDMPEIQASLDVGVLASAAGEGFPNVVGETMACGVPCVVTDVGDAALVVGETGMVVPPRDAGALAQGCLQILRMDSRTRSRLGEQARERICRQFSIAEISRRYVEIWREVAGMTEEGGRNAA